MKIKSNAKWKSIPLSQNFFANIESATALCGGIEELTDYTLVTKGSKPGKVHKRPLSCPKKTSLASEDVTQEEPPVKKKKNVFNVVETENEKPELKTKVKEKKTKQKKVKSSSKPVINLDALNLSKPITQTGKINQNKWNKSNCHRNKQKGKILKKK